MQLDIFDDSRDVMLRNDVLGALQRRDAHAADAAWATLRGEYPSDSALGPLSTLIGALQPAMPEQFSVHLQLRQAWLHLADHVAPAAVRMFGAQDGAAWVRPLWRGLAERAAALPFSADHPEDHAAPFWLRAGDAKAACLAVTGIDSWRRIPAPLGWMAEARVRRDGLDTSWPLLVELAWLAPARFAAVCQTLSDPALNKLLKAFGAGFDGQGEVADLAWFPAWALTQKPALAALLAPAQPSRQSPPERVMRLLVELLGLERQGRQHDMIAHRKRLQSLQPALYADYMKSR